MDISLEGSQWICSFHHFRLAQEVIVVLRAIIIVYKYLYYELHLLHKLHILKLG